MTCQHFIQIMRFIHFVNNEDKNMMSGKLRVFLFYQQAFLVDIHPKVWADETKSCWNSRDGPALNGTSKSSWWSGGKFVHPGWCEHSAICRQKGKITENEQGPSDVHGPQHHGDCGPCWNFTSQWCVVISVTQLKRNHISFSRATSMMLWSAGKFLWFHSTLIHLWISTCGWRLGTVSLGGLERTSGIVDSRLTM